MLRVKCRQKVNKALKSEVGYNGIFHKTKTNYFKMYMKPQKTPNSQSNLEKEES